jgi:hypothetical protein
MIRPAGSVVWDSAKEIAHRRTKRIERMVIGGVITAVLLIALVVAYVLPLKHPCSFPEINPALKGKSYVCDAYNPDTAVGG